MPEDTSLGHVSLVGTVHVSLTSRQRVISTITDEEPDIVAIELDPDRFTEMKDAAESDEPRQQSVLDLLHALLTGEVSLPGALARYGFHRAQSSMAEVIDVEPGMADMIPAHETADSQDIPTALIDDTADTTMEELGSAFSLSTFTDHLGAQGVISVATAVSTLQSFSEEFEETGGTATPEDAKRTIEKLEQMPYAQLRELMDAVDVLLGPLTQHLLHERNEIMAGHLRWLQLNGYDVVAVMGRAHVPGVQDLLATPESIPEDRIVAPSVVEPPTSE